MNAASEMSIWLVMTAIFTFQIQFSSIHSFSTVYRHSESGRKLFGGYRIVPKACSGTSGTSKQKTGTCMFNYECSQRGGHMIGTCIDGFLFGVCCSVTLPPSLADVSLGSSTTNKPLTRIPVFPQLTSNNTDGGVFIENEGLLLHSYPSADTILLNHDGTVVEDDKNPENIFTPQNVNRFPSKFTTPSSYRPAQTFNYVFANEDLLGHNKHPPTKMDPIPSNGLDLTISAIQKVTNGPTTHKYSSWLTQPQSYTHETKRPVPSSISDQEHTTFIKYPKPETFTAAATFHKKTQPVPMPLPPSTSNPPFVIAEDNLVLLETISNQNASRRPTTKRPQTNTSTTNTPKTITPTTKGSVPNIGTTNTVSTRAPNTKFPTTRVPTTRISSTKVSSTKSPDTQSTSKASSKPLRPTTKLPGKPTVSSHFASNQKYTHFNYNTYTGISKPPILITHPVGLDDGGQAISHIIGILNATTARPESITQPMNMDAGLSTWVSIIDDDKPIKTKYPKPGTARPGSTATTYVHGPSFSVGTGTKPVPTVVVIGPGSPSNEYDSKPTKKPSSSHTNHSTRKPIRPTEETVTLRPHRPTGFYENNVFHNGQENLVNFPPVRNPDLNATGLNQMEKPTVVETYATGQNTLVQLPSGITLEVLPEDGDELNEIDADSDDDYDDITTPSLQEDKVETQVHVFVEKIVNSLSGNFQDLEQLLFKNENKTSIANSNGVELHDIHVGEEIGTETAIPSTLTTTRTPVRRPTTIKSPEYYETTLLETSTYVPPKGTKPTTKRPSTGQLTTLPGIIIKRPTTPVSTVVRPSGVPSLAPSKKPGSTTVTKRPAPSIITASKRPTTNTPTRRPVSTVTTKRPVVTKRPKPTTTTKRTTIVTTTTEVTESVPENEEATVTETHESSPEASTMDFRRECGVRPLVKKGGRIVGGKGSQFGYYPWQVLVRESTWLGLFTKNKCGGVLITNKFVITAAHCQPGFLASLVAVFGEYDISGELEAKRSVAKNVRRVIVHRQYDPATFENDLALLELDSPVTYEEHIVPICMPRDGEDYVGRMATVTGWGRLKYGGGVPSVLQEVRVPLIENSVCQEMFHTAGHQKRIINSFLCAGYANGQKDSCEGDSGGPLMVEREDGRWVLLGTVSHGIKCAAPYLPGVYMRTTFYKPWLKSITGVNT